MRDALRHGWLFSRWVPNLALGYGYPFFNYREPLPYLAGEGFIHLVSLTVGPGLFYALSLMAAAYGAFVLCRELFGHARCLGGRNRIWTCALSPGGYLPQG